MSMVSQTANIYGKKESEAENNIKVRKSGGIQKKLMDKFVNMKDDIEEVVADTANANPLNSLTWTISSLHSLMEAWMKKGLKPSMTRLRKY